MPTSRPDRIPGHIPANFTYRSLGQAGVLTLSELVRRPPHNPADTEAAINAALEKAATSFGLYPLGYTHAQETLGDNWYLDDKFAFINIIRLGRRYRGAITVIADNEDDFDQAIYVRLLNGEQVTDRLVESDIPGAIVYRKEFRNKAEFLEALAAADLAVRDDDAAQAVLALANLANACKVSR